MGHDPAHHCSAYPGMMAKGERPSQDTSECTSLSSLITLVALTAFMTQMEAFFLFLTLKAACHIISCMLIILKLFQLRYFFKRLCPNIIFGN